MARLGTPKWLRAARASPDDPRRPGAKTDWLGRALARAGILPFSDADAAIKAGRVALCGRIVREPLTAVRPGDEVRLDGRPVDLGAETIVLMFHKPKGTLTTLRDPRGRATVFDVLLSKLPPDLSRFGWHAVGRLDRDTTGLLLFTNDERFVAFATLPASKLPKRYLAHVSGKLEEARLEPLHRGIELHDGRARPAQVRIRGPALVELTLVEGRHHQAKRMLGAVKLPVTRLHREAVGRLELDVGEGEWRRLSEVEIRDRLGYVAATFW